uniref:Glycosyltransferase n=1 Tax=viral metagenome TaxID=1070528 RepID=A0A6M3L776_9ZZZZ
MGKNIISYSVWGSNPKYTNGALENLKCAKQFYPDWICRFYVGNNVPKPIVEALEMKPCEVVKVDRDGSKDGLFWRFSPAWDPDVDVFLSRDTDSRIIARECAAVHEWLTKFPQFMVHTIRDNPSHTAHLMGGLSGYRKGFMPNFKQELDAYVAAMQPTIEGRGDPRTPYFNSDQHFLTEKVWPVVRMSVLAHDECHHFNGLERKFPLAMQNGVFCGA